MDPLHTEVPLLLEIIARLTPRQLEIIALLAEGKSNKDIATILSISRETVKRHVYRACLKMEVENRMQMIFTYGIWKGTQEDV